jgi:hypothetical protein
MKTKHFVCDTCGWVPHLPDVTQCWRPACRAKQGIPPVEPAAAARIEEVTASRDTHKKNVHALAYGAKPDSLLGKQTWWGSIVEAKANIVVGFVVAVICNRLVLPWFGFPATIVDSTGIALIFTVVSVIRQLIVRRFFNNLKWGHHK